MERGQKMMLLDWLIMKGPDMEQAQQACIFCVLFFGILCSLFTLLIGKTRKRIAYRELGIETILSAGFDSSGLPLFCGINEHDFVFIDSLGRQRGHIARHAVIEIIVTDDTRPLLHQRTEVMRARATAWWDGLGTHSLLRWSGWQHYRRSSMTLMIEWHDTVGTPQRLMCSFTASNADTHAYELVEVLLRNLTDENVTAAQ